MLFLILPGVVLISLALCADAAIGNVQEKAMKLHNGSNSEMVTPLLLLPISFRVNWMQTSIFGLSFKQHCEFSSQVKFRDYFLSLFCRYYILILLDLCIFFWVSCVWVGWDLLWPSVLRSVTNKKNTQSLFYQVISGCLFIFMYDMFVCVCNNETLCNITDELCVC